VLIKKKNVEIHIYDWVEKIYTYVKSTLTKDDLQELTNKCKSINNMCSGDGAGLLGGCLVDILLSKYFKEKFTDNYQELHVERHANMRR
jgi:hypothetical protein